MRFTKRAGRVLLAGVLTAGLAVVVQPSASAANSLELRFFDRPDTVQAFSSAASGAGVAPVRYSCVAVEVTDEAGNRVTSPSVEVTLSSDAGLGLNGPYNRQQPVKATTVDGLATFGTAPCTDTGVTSANVGLHNMTASARIRGATIFTPAAPFSVLQVYGDCASDCSTGTVNVGETSAQLSAKGSGPARLTFSVGVDPWTFEISDCDPDPGASGINRYRQPVTVDIAARDKTVVLRWSKTAVLEHTNNGSSLWLVCLAAEAAFNGRNGTGSTIKGGWYIDALLDCRDRVVATDPCVVSNVRNKGEQVTTVEIPNRDGDPRMI